MKLIRNTLLNLVFFSANMHCLGDFICMSPGKGPGIVYSLSEFVQNFYKSPHVVAQHNN